MSRTLHVCLDIEGALRWHDIRLVGLLKDSRTGQVLQPRAARMVLRKHLSEGRKLLPIGEPCEGFDYETGCPGHEVKE